MCYRSMAYEMAAVQALQVRLEGWSARLCCVGLNGTRSQSLCGACLHLLLTACSPTIFPQALYTTILMSMTLSQCRPCRSPSSPPSRSGLFSLPLTPDWPPPARPAASSEIRRRYQKRRRELRL